MKPAVSIIVPAYKAEQYLNQCVDSLLAQTLSDIEILLVDDGSPDRSGEICDNYAKQDKRIRVIHQQNQGVSVARNVGIKAASGKYLMFVDSDDWVDPDYCKEPYELAERTGADCVMFKYVWYENGRYEQKEDYPEGEKTKLEAMNLMNGGVGIGPSNKLFRRELFDEIQFPEGRRYEDIVVLPRLVQASRKIWYLNKPLHFYRGNENSSTHAFTHKANKDMFEMSVERIRMLEEWGYKELADGGWNWPCWTYLVREGRFSEHSAEALEHMRSLPGGADHFSGSRKILYHLLINAPVLFDAICILTGRRAKQ